MSSPQPSFFSFKSVIENSKMKVRIYFIWPRVMKGNKTITWVHVTRLTSPDEGGGGKVIMRGWNKIINLK